MLIEFSLITDDLEITEKVTISKQFKEKVVQPILKVAFKRIHGLLIHFVKFMSIITLTLITGTSLQVYL